jgi:hypothetical protein
MFAPRGNAGHPTLQALMERQQELANRKGGVPQIQSWTQGAAHMVDKLFEGLEVGRTNRRLAEGNQVQADVLSQADPTTGLISPEQLDPLASWNPELFYKLMSDYRQQQNTNAELEIARAKAAGEGGPKMSDVSTMRGQLMGDESYTAASNIGQIYGSMLKSAPKDDRTSDLDMVSGLAKMIDPTGVVRGEDVNMIVANQPGMELFRSYLETWTTDPTARLGPDIRKDMMRLAFDRASGAVGAYNRRADEFRQIAKAYNIPEHLVVPTFGEITPWEPEEAPPTDPANPDTPADPDVPPYMPRPAGYSGTWPTEGGWRHLDPETRQYYIDAATAAAGAGNTR